MHRSVIRRLEIRDAGFIGGTGNAQRSQATAVNSTTGWNVPADIVPKNDLIPLGSVVEGRADMDIRAADLSARGVAAAGTGKIEDEAFQIVGFAPFPGCKQGI